MPNFAKVDKSTKKIIQTLSRDFSAVSKDEDSFDYYKVPDDYKAGDSYDGTTHTPYKDPIDWTPRKVSFEAAYQAYLSGALALDER